MYLFRTRTYLCSHHTVLAVTCSVQKNLQSLLVHHLKTWRKVCLKGEG